MGIKVVLERLHLYNRGLSYGAQTISRVLEQEGVRPLPSISTINRILKRNCLTHRAAPVIILRTILGTDYGMVFRLNVGLYTAGNPILFTGILLGK